MDQDSFIRRHTSEWGWLRKMTAGGGPAMARLSGPQIDDVVRSYLRVSGQLAEAQGHYRDPALLEHVNDVVRGAQAAVYADVPRTQPGLLRLFGTSYREAARRSAKFILLAVAILAVSTAVSWWWTVTNAEAREVLFPGGATDALRMSSDGTEIQIAQSPAFAVYLFTHNILVSFFAFALGITAGIGTVWLLVTNGIMLGTISGLFTVAGHAGAFWNMVLPHGMLELLAICIAAGAGLRMGWPMIAPGDQPRSEAIRDGGMDAVIVVLGVVPAFIIAGLIESFISGTSVPDPIELLIGFAAAGGYILFLLGLEPFRDAGTRIVYVVRYSLPRALMSK